MNQPKKNKNDSELFLSYLPHAVNKNVFRKLTTEEELKEVDQLRFSLFGNRKDDIEFCVLYNNRNIRRKMTGDVILAFQHFIQHIPIERRKKCVLIMHTAPVDENGTDLYAVFRDVAPDVEFVFSPPRLEPKVLNMLYNISDVVINLASNEGFGIATLEGIMAERLIIINVTGGLQDQAGFEDEHGKQLHPEKHFNEQWGSNHDGKYQKHGEWAFICFPTQLALQGSPPTPYIFDDRCDWRHAGNHLVTIFNMTKEERERRGKKGREWAIQNNFSSESMGKRFIEIVDETLKRWKPRKRIILEKAE